MNAGLLTIVENVFNKIFISLSEELKEDVSNLQLVIYYGKNGNKYSVYKNYKDGNEIVLDNYLNVLYLGFATTIDSSIMQGGPRYAKELTEKLNKPVNVDDVSIMMKYKKNELPLFVLMAFQKEQREINIEQEF